MTNFEKITASPDVLGEFLASLNVADGPWDEAFHRTFCDGCQSENCDAENCPHNAERNNPMWWLNQAAERQSTESTKAKTYITEATEAIAAAVSATNQTYVDALKNAGKFDAEAQKEAAKKALDACLLSISPAAQRFIESAYGDIKEYLTTRIEAEVRKQKNEAPMVLSAPVLGELIPTVETTEG